MLDPQPTDSEQVSLLKIASRVGATVSGGEFPYVLWQKIVRALGGAVNGMENKHTLVRKAAKLWGANVDGSEFESVLLYKSAVALGATVDPGDESEWLLYLIASNVGSTPTPTLPALSPVTGLTAIDNGSGSLTIDWTDPASVPNNLRVVVKQAGVTIHNDATGAGSGEVSYSGAGTFDVYVTNEGDGIANIDSPTESILGVTVGAAPTSFNPSDYGTVAAWLKADAIPSEITNGTGHIDCSTSSALIFWHGSGANTAFLSEAAVGDELYDLSNTLIGTVLSITNDTFLTLTANALVTHTDEPFTIKKLSNFGIHSWPDSSGNGNDVTQATSSKQPTFKANILNGKPVVRFDGVDDILQKTGFSLTRPFTAFVVYQSRENTGRTIGGDASQSNNWLLGSHALGAVWHYAGGIVFAVTGTTNVWYLLSAIDGASDTTAWINGVLAGTSGALGEIGDVLDIGGGGESTGGVTEYGTVDVAEIIFYSEALNDTNRQAVQSSLSTKYALSP